MVPRTLEPFGKQVQIDEEERIQINQEGLDRDIGVLAIVNFDTCHDTFNIVWANDNAMILEGILD